MAAQSATSSSEPRRLTIQKLAEEGNTSIRNIQKYIAIGLLRPPVGKTRHAYYVQSHVVDLLEIRKQMAMGGSLAAVGELMAEQRRSAAQKAATEAAVQPVRDGAGALTTLNLAEDLVITVFRNLKMAQEVQQLLMNDLRKAFDKARRGAEALEGASAHTVGTEHALEAAGAAA